MAGSAACTTEMGDGQMDSDGASAQVTRTDAGREAALVASGAVGYGAMCAARRKPHPRDGASGQ